MKILYNLLLVSAIVMCMSACTKDINTITNSVIDKMMVNKTWHLDHTIIGNNTQSYVGQTSYSITYFKDGTIKDSDGLKGTYTITNNNGQYQVQVKGTSVNGNALNYTHSIESVSEVTMVQSFMLAGQASKTSLYFTSK